MKKYKIKQKLFYYYLTPCIHPIGEGPGTRMMEKSLLLPIALIDFGFILLYKK